MDAKTAARIDALTSTTGWKDLTVALAEQEQKFWDRHMADLKRGEPIDQRALDRALGKLDGIRAIIGVPAKAAATLLREEQQEDDGA